MNKRIIWAIAALLALAGIAVSVKIYMNEKKADAEARMHSKIEYDEWFDDHFARESTIGTILILAIMCRLYSTKSE